jgi:hypothetical protein
LVVDDEEAAPTLHLNGREHARLRVGEERPPLESPCPGCGAYYFTLHATGCEDEQCPACGGQLVSCGCG